MNSTATDPTGSPDGPPASEQPPTWAYEMRPITTAADRAVAAALIEDRRQWLAQRGLDSPARVAEAFRDPRAEAVGLYDDDRGQEILVGCLLLHRQPDPPEGYDGSSPALTVSLAYSAPGRTARAGWLITLWLADFAARTGRKWVYAEAPGRHPRFDCTPCRLLDHLRDLDWQVLGPGHDSDGHRVVRLKLAAHAHPDLAALIHCTVPLHPAETRHEPEEGTTR
ncbi:hypothetical protein [Streptomyces sp. DT195]|uniref:hypothetical protein n=1 Tax=Streptomyces sp. DT195 TaxID=3393419 RepID=UPI003CF5E135